MPTLAPGLALSKLAVPEPARLTPEGAPIRLTRVTAVEPSAALVAVGKTSMCWLMAAPLARVKWPE
jgi:hypothetical protein